MHLRYHFACGFALVPLFFYWSRETVCFMDTALYTSVMFYTAEYLNF
jgi:hypothetical protein